MRLPWPDHVSVRMVLIFSGIVAILQLSMGTSLVFALCLFVFNFLAAMAFNAGGGFYRFPGAFIGFFFLEMVGIGEVVKIFMVEAADSSLRNPALTGAVFDIGMFVLLMAVTLGHKLARREPVYDARPDEHKLMQMSMAATAIGLTGQFLVWTYGMDNADYAVQQGTIWSYISQAGLFLPLGQVLGTAYILLESKGKRSIRWWTGLPLAFMVFYGLVVNSKQGILQPIVTWFLVCLIFRYRFTKLQLASIAMFMVLSSYVIFPVVQMSRGEVRFGSFSNRVELVYNYVRSNDVLSLHKQYEQEAALAQSDDQRPVMFFYGRDEGLLDRITMIGPDDALIDWVSKNGSPGMHFLGEAVISLVPRFILHDKNFVALPNELGRITGVIAPNDFGTFIAFGLFGSSMYVGGWMGLTFLMFAIMTAFFAIVESLYGTAKTNVYAIFPIMSTMHGAPETVITAPVTATFALIFWFYLSISIIRLVAPFIGAMLIRSRLMPKSAFAGLEGVAIMPAAASARG